MMDHDLDIDMNTAVDIDIARSRPVIVSIT